MQQKSINTQSQQNLFKIQQNLNEITKSIDNTRNLQQKYNNIVDTNILNRHISQLSTGKNLLCSTPNEVQQLKGEFIPQIRQRLLEKQKLIGTSNNYYSKWYIVVLLTYSCNHFIFNCVNSQMYQGNGKLKKETLNNYSSILFKSGYEQQEEIKRLNKENEDLKEIIKKQEEKLQQFLEIGDILEQNRQLQEKVERLEKQIQQENQQEQSQKIENE